jgi:hypothetical protein
MPLSPNRLVRLLAPLRLQQWQEKSCTTGKAGGLKDYEPLKAVENQEPPEGDC